MAFRVGRKVAIAVSAATTVIQSANVPREDVEGVLIEIKVDIPTVANGITFTFSIEDEEGDTRYSIAALPKAVKSIVMPNRIIQRGYTYGILVSGASGTAISVVLSPTYEV
jgi:hypothetical protein